MRAFAFLILIIFSQSILATDDYLNMILTPEGLGPIKIGANLKQISRILKTDVTKAKHKYIENDCYSYSLGDHPIFGGNIKFLINKGSLGEITIFTDKIKTDRGLTVNKSITEAEKLYSGLFKKGKTHYGDIKLSIEYHESKTKMKMVGSKDFIRYIAVGRKPEIDFVEGCL